MSRIWWSSFRKCSFIQEGRFQGLWWHSTYYLDRSVTDQVCNKHPMPLVCISVFLCPKFLQSLFISRIFGEEIGDNLIAAIKKCNNWKLGLKFNLVTCSPGRGHFSWLAFSSRHEGLQSCQQLFLQSFLNVKGHSSASQVHGNIPPHWETAQKPGVGRHLPNERINLTLSPHLKGLLASSVSMF